MARRRRSWRSTLTAVLKRAGVGSGARLQREALQRRRQPGEPRVEARGPGAADLRVQLQRPQPRQVPKVRAALPQRQMLLLCPLYKLWRLAADTGRGCTTVACQMLEQATGWQWNTLHDMTEALKWGEHL